MFISFSPPFYSANHIQDLTTCRIDEVTPELRVATPIMGHGSLWGSKKLNDLFKEKVVEILGSEVHTIADHLSISVETVIEGFVRGFEKAKQAFDGDEQEDMKIPFAIGLNLPIIETLPCLKRRCIKVPISTIMEIFQTYTAHIESLLNDQVSKIKALGEYDYFKIEIICCGGGSRSPYIHRTLSEHFAQYDISCYMKEQHDYSMVAKGAFLATVDPKLGAREHARTSFGTLMHVEWDANTHSKWEKMETEPWSGWEWEARNRLCWLVMRGESVINPPRPFTTAGVIHIPLPARGCKWPLELSQPIYSCEVEPIAITQEVR